MDKQALRERVWDALQESGDARFPFPPHGRIPNFAGAGEAADQLAMTDEWEEAGVIKSNPDSPQRPVRRHALESGKIVYMAVPRLRDEECFLKLDPSDIVDINHATTIGGSAEIGEPVHPEEVPSIDLIVAGSVAVNERGARVGKGEGYSDLEFAILRECGVVDDETTTVTTVHELQVIDDEIPTTPQDVPIDLIVTPERELYTTSPRQKPNGIAWELLDAERIEEIPILDHLNQNQ